MSARRTALAGSMMVATRLGTRLLDLVSLLILARLLSPADFGLVAIAASIVAVVEAALELPLNQALLRLESIEPNHYHTAFTLGALRCSALYLILLIAVFPLAHLYGDPRLVPLVLVLGLGALSRGMINPRLAEFQKVLSFWRDMAIEVLGRVAGTLIGIGFAVVTRSYWSVAAAAIAAPTATLVASYVFAPYRPRYSLVSMPVFADTLGWLSLAQVFGTMNWQCERLLLGRFIPVAQLGLFTTASDLSLIPFLALFGPILRPLLAAFHSVRTDQTRLTRSYRLATRAVIMIGMPILVGESLMAEQIVYVILGDRWLGIVPLLRWLAPSLIPALFVMPFVSFVTAFGQTRDIAIRNALEFSAKLPMLWIAYSAFGLPGVALSRLASETATAIYCMRIVRRMIGLSVRRQLLDAWPCALATATMISSVLLLRFTTAVAPRFALFDLAAGVTVGAMAYIATLFLIWHLNGRPDGLEAMAAGTLAKLRLGLGERMSRTVQAVRTE